MNRRIILTATCAILFLVFGINDVAHGQSFDVYNNFVTRGGTGTINADQAGQTPFQYGYAVRSCRAIPSRSTTGTARWRRQRRQ